ncbi:MAG: hypothetical protein GYA45_04450 [Pelolinea sp.]|jgi:hypothetical protein|nr:hypothetical protein [Pelolinea sp.]
MNLAYLAPRAIRHFMPEKLADWMKRRNLIIKAGVETMDPFAAVNRYEAFFDTANISIQNKTLMVFGYGGNILTGCELLKRGAKQVVLCERQGFPFLKFNQEQLKNYPAYFFDQGDGPQPDPRYFQIVHDDIRTVAADHKIDPVDLILSSSVFEHLDDVDTITHALACLTKASGKQVHFIDLRDHFFKYPFEMLTFSDAVWKRFLNPTSNLNRYRLFHYEAIFRKNFKEVRIQVQESDQAAFLQVKERIRKEFLSGDDSIDSATLITVEATK